VGAQALKTIELIPKSTINNIILLKRKRRFT